MATIARVSNVADFIRAVEACVMRWGNEGPYWFRGQAQSEWRLVPKLFRFQNPDEVALRVDFERLGMELLTGRRSPANHWEWYFLAQHFGLPTRLLDWTESALFALFFAVREPQDSHDPAVWILNPTWLNEESVSRRYIARPEEEQLSDWLPKDPGAEVKVLSAIAIAPPHVDRRLAVQRSAFVLFGKDPAALSEAESIPEARLAKIEIVGKNAASLLLAELKLLGIWETTVLRKNISLGLEPGIVLRNLEETASTAEGLLHHEGRVELAEDPGRSSSFSVSRLALQNFARSREFVPAQATRVLSRAKGQAPTCRQSHSLDAGAAEPLVQLARRSHCREAQDLSHLAQKGLPHLLALEVRSWPAIDPGRAPTSDSQNGAREPDVGRGADRKRAAAEARFTGVAAHHSEVYAEVAEGAV